MAYVRLAVSVELALMLAVVGPWSSKGGSADRISNHSNQSNSSHCRSILNSTNQSKSRGKNRTWREEARSSVDDGPGGTRGCAVEKVLPGTSKQVRGFVENVNRISATEVVEHERMNKEGAVIQQEHHKFNYVAEIQETRPGILNMDEYRDGSRGQNGFPGEVSTVGITSLVLIFHPYHINEFEMTCEGTDEWQGHVVWKVRFEQRIDKPARMSTLRVGDANYPILLKGTALIDVENYQIVHLETDILKPVPEVRLMTEHQVLDYGPVRFEQKKLSLWLPLEAEIYLDVNGKRFHHRHVYSDYRVFSVELGQKTAAPR